MKKEIPIFFAINNNEAKLLMVAINSIKNNASLDNNYNINIVYDYLNEENKKNLLKFNAKNFKINLIKGEEIVKKNKFTNLEFDMKYYRYFLAKKFNELDKAIYLDYDVVLCSDIAKLFDINLGDNLLGAVPDEMVNKVCELISYTNDCLDINAQNYINSGVLVMNFKVFREENLENNFVKLLNQKSFILFKDQTYLNLLCKDRIKYLDLSWNKMPFDRSLNEKEINLIHYNLNYKPWRYKGVNYENSFWQNAKQIKLENQFKRNRLEFLMG